MPAEYYCDICESQDEAQEEWDGRILCKRHRLESELYYETKEYKEKRDWVKNVHLKDLAERRARIAKIKAALKEYNVVE